MPLYKTNTVRGSSSQNNKKKKLLLKILLPISLLIIALSIFLGCWFGCNYKATFILNNDESIINYLNKHKSVHKNSQEFNGNNLTNENRKYYANNVNGQNLLNGIMSYYFGDSDVNGGIYGSKWEVKHGKNWASLKSLDNTLDTAWARTQSPQHDCWKCFDRYVYVKKETSQIKIHYEWWYEVYSSQEKVNHWTDYDLNFLNDYVDIGTSLIYVGEENPTFGLGSSVPQGHVTNTFFHFVQNLDQANYDGVGPNGDIYHTAYRWFDFPRYFSLSKLDYPNCSVVY